MLTLAMAAFVRMPFGTRCGASRFALMAESMPGNRLAMQALVARLRAQAAETSLEFFRNKFEAAADDLERQLRLPKMVHSADSGPKSPDTENGRGYGH